VEQRLVYYLRRPVDKSMGQKRHKGIQRGFEMGRIVIAGATGFIGAPIAEAALALNHECVVVTRELNDRNRQALEGLRRKGAEIRYSDTNDIPAMTEVLDGADVVLCALGEPAIYGHVEHRILEAAQLAGVSRFVPTEFGLDTLRLPYGVGALFDEKKRFQEALQESAVDFTIIFNGGVFDYFLPNLRFYEAITVFGESHEVPYYTHSREDLGAVTIQASFDPRCRNQYIHLKANRVTQEEVLSKLAEFHPDFDFPKAHVSSAEILDGTHEVKAAIWIDGQAGKSDPRSVDAAELFPDYRFKTVDEALADPEFVFGVRA